MRKCVYCGLTTLRKGKIPICTPCLTNVAPFNLCPQCNKPVTLDKDIKSDGMHKSCSDQYWFNYELDQEYKDSEADRIYGYN